MNSIKDQKFVTVLVEKPKPTKMKIKNVSLLMNCHQSQMIAAPTIGDTLYQSILLTMNTHNNNQYWVLNKLLYVLHFGTIQNKSMIKFT